MTRLLARVTRGCIVLLAVSVVLMMALGARVRSPQVVYTTRDVMLYDVYARQSIALSDARLSVPVSLSWSPDGRYIAYYTLDRAAYRLTVLEARTLTHQSLNQLVASGAAASWSPDSMQILVLMPNDSQQIDACALSIRDFSLRCFPLGVNVGMAAWSPREAMWALVYYERSKGQCVGVFDIDTQRLQDYECGAAYTHPSWSPDGTHFVYLRVKEADPTEIVLREVSTGEQTRYSPNIVSYLAQWQTDTRILLESGHRDYTLNPQDGSITPDTRDDAVRSATAYDSSGRYEAAVMSLTQGNGLELMVRHTDGYNRAPIARWRRVGEVTSYAFAWRP